MVPWVGLQYLSVVFSDHTHLLFALGHIDRKVFKDGDQSTVIHVYIDTLNTRLLTIFQVITSNAC